MRDLNQAFSRFPTLKTQRFLLRQVNSTDLPTMFRIRSDPKVMRYYGSNPINSLLDAQRIIDELQSAFHNQLGIRWMIALPDKDEMIGSCGFWRILKPHYRAEVGYDLAPEYWGQGVMSEALEAILDWGFRQMGLNSVEAQIDPENLGSRRVLEKCGFQQEGHLRQAYCQNGVFTDTTVFGLLASDWDKLHPIAK
jgi:ribosomal-protein-alanine N-acetyltransferase